MSIVHSCTSMSFSGLERYVVDLAAGQKKAGHDVLVFCRKGSDIEKACLEQSLSTWTLAENEEAGIRVWLKLWKAWRAFKKDVFLHLHHAGELKIHRPFLKILKRLGILKKVILQFHLWITHDKNDFYHRWLYSAVDEIWCSSQSAKENFMEILPVAGDKIKIIPYGRPVQQLKELDRPRLRAKIRKDLQIPEQAVAGVCISRLEPIKGVGELVTAFAVLAARFNDFHLILVGGPSPKNQESAEFAENLQRDIQAMPEGIHGRIHQVGFQSHSEEYLCAGDFYILPSYEECMSLALLDALILGLPVVGTKSGGTPSVVLEGKTGFLAQPRDPESLRRGMETLVQSAELRRKLGEEGAVLGAVYDEGQVFQRVLNSY